MDFTQKSLININVIKKSIFCHFIDISFLYNCFCRRINKNQNKEMALKNSQITEVVFVVKMLSLLEEKGLGDKLSFYDYIDEEFESDDGEEWIKL